MQLRVKRENSVAVSEFQGGESREETRGEIGLETGRKYFTRVDLFELHRESESS